jgi:outer membrane lipoprotein-sorting protein
MTRSVRRAALALGVALCSLAPVPARALGGEPAPGGECAREVAARVQRRYDRIGDLRARFTQSTRSVTLGTGGPAPSLEAEGEVLFAKPGRMRWSYTRPEPSLVVSDGETLWIYDPAAREVQRMAVTGAFLSGAALQFLLGEGDLLGSFEVASADCPPGGPLPDRIELELSPREPTHYERLSLVVETRSGEVVATTVVDLFGNVTRVELREVEVDRAPPPELFRFDAPPGVRVLDLAPGAAGSPPATQ